MGFLFLYFTMISFFCMENLYLIKNTDCPNEQVVALLSVIASNYATKTEKNEN